jgi:G6PDH family F420-dependent oxidoreductase
MDPEMLRLGYSLSCEEHPPCELVRQARRAEQAGFEFAMISDHFHPWTHRQGNSAFVWTVIGAIAQSTETLMLGTAVTCPTIRIHPAIIAQAAATAVSLMPGRFMLGVGTGENLNEHIVGVKWPAPRIRSEMLEEAVDVIRMLWRGGWQSHYGEYYTVERARLFTLPEQMPPILVAAATESSAKTAGRSGDGLISTKPRSDLIEAFREAGGDGKPTMGQLTVCWAESEKEARRRAREFWPNALVSSEVSAELPLPRHFEQLTEEASEDQIAEIIVCGPRPETHIEAINKFAEAGFNHVFVHQVGDQQDGFFDFYRNEIIPRYGSKNSNSVAESASCWSTAPRSGDFSQS